MAENQFIRVGMASSVIRKYRASATTPPGDRFTPPSVGFFSPVASSRFSSNAPGSDFGALDEKRVLHRDKIRQNHPGQIIPYDKDVL